MATETKEKLIRVLQLMQTTDEKTPMNATQIVEKLSTEYELEGVDRRSIYRDIALLQDCGYDIVQTTDRRSGWYMNTHAFADWQIKIMMDAVQQARCVSINEAMQIRENLLNLTSKRGRIRFSHMMMPHSGNVNAKENIGAYIETMFEAIYQHRKIEFQYTEINDDMKKVLRREGKKYLLNLYAIYWSDNNYYLIGAHDNHDNLVNYRLDRIVNLTMSEEKAIDAKEKVGVNPEMIIQEYIEKSVDHFQGELIRVEVEYEPGQAANAILYDFAGENIRVRKLENGRCRAVFQKMDSVTLVGWFMQHAGIYWMFDSGKQNGFKALIYIHRYDADTVGRVRTDYLHKVQKYVETAMQSAQYTIDNATSASEKSKATKAVTKYTKQLAEMRIYDEAIAHIANQRIEIDLDDGVKVNYAKFQGVEVAQEGKKALKVDLLAKI